MTSEPFAIPSKAYLNRLAVLWLSDRWMWLVLPVIAVITWAIFDARAIYVGLIVIFLLYPIALTLVLCDYAPSLQSIRAITSKRMTVSDHGLLFEFLPKTEDQRPLDPVSYTWDDIISAEISAKSVFIVIGSRLDDRIEIPFEVLTERQSSLLTDRLSDKLPSASL